METKRDWEEYSKYLEGVNADRKKEIEDLKLEIRALRELVRVKDEENGNIKKLKKENEELKAKLEW